ncbi:MAG: nucleotidyl transferase AbiEii/AbiGii toxin family protein [Mesorhizobium sp.]|uniref:nucleotidyl transferase AbiEii/AbiGii toxin family protein n=1 Tax=Mesorhizobium sp. TaxID=1871066 RepID=UPI000FE6665E|nr:nucleotidyl transferase AbiEii/AbiGii toxin family protein [Mesorhizobium sp.]RWH94130.1 MAG: nucleotidyl transferase AbiEii/AbiGii toxin family protein [Mesorhizobium sp.]RWK82759.1 MAG: nucleotidyl transferase AbiEii/AbiGii toxin family protein [Mesorhizobium sp.]RWL06566.1 MAG: nucleotidyl transferase AbiEii/AbiGii toxin family protein [Mesorhizobium sp.]
MDTASPYYRQVRLLTRVLPLVAAETSFALKGGTAINLFVRDLPRLSVDIDLVYLPMEDRDEALKNIAEALSRVADAIVKAMPDTEIIRAYEDQADALRLFVSQRSDRIKIELSPVLRGSVFPEELREVSPAVEEQFGYVEMQLLSIPDLYAGKICAALDRQHPRDLFDVKLLFENEGLSDDLVKTFLVYLISHNRTMAELLQPTRKDIAGIYEGEFLRMSQIDVSLDELLAVRERLITEINQALTDEQRKFLLSFKARRPKWELLGIDGVDKLPAVRWKLQNLERMSEDRHRRAYNDLERVLGQKGR